MSEARARLVVALGSTLISLAVLEGSFRLLGFDFAGQERALGAWPIAYREPRVPVGEAFFERAGGESWRGQVVHTALRLSGFEDTAWTDEPAIEIRYDAHGFRNPPDLRDWRVVVVGDSFVELGHLPDADLTTNLLAQRLGVPVKNLGVSYTGPRAEVFFLSAYGAAPSAREAVLVFYEGNDLADLTREEAALSSIRAGQPRPLRAIVPQSSFLKAMADLALTLPGRLPHPPRLKQNGWFPAAEGRLAVSVNDCSAEAPPPVRASLNQVVGAFADTARQRGLTPFVAYMPCKARVLAGRATDLAGDPLPPVTGPLPQVVAVAAERSGARFVDLVPALRAETKGGRLTYSGVFDTHLNAHGSAVVARVLAEAIAGPPP